MKIKLPNAIFALASLSLIVILYIGLINSSVIPILTCIITPIIWIIQIPIIGIWVITITGIMIYTMLVGIPSTSTWYRNEKRVAITLMITVSLGFLILPVKHKGDVFLTLCLVSIIYPIIQIIRMELMSTLNDWNQLGKTKTKIINIRKGEYHEKN